MRDYSPHFSTGAPRWIETSGPASALDTEGDGIMIGRVLAFVLAAYIIALALLLR